MSLDLDEIVLLIVSGYLHINSRYPPIDPVYLPVPVVLYTLRQVRAALA
jgi:hypothetical protein